MIEFFNCNRSSYFLSTVTHLSIKEIFIYLFLLLLSIIRAYRLTLLTKTFLFCIFFITTSKRKYKGVYQRSHPS